MVSSSIGTGITYYWYNYVALWQTPAVRSASDAGAALQLCRDVGSRQDGTESDRLAKAVVFRGNIMSGDLC